MSMRNKIQDTAEKAEKAHNVLTVAIIVMCLVAVIAAKESGYKTWEAFDNAPNAALDAAMNPGKHYR